MTKMYNTVPQEEPIPLAVPVDSKQAQSIPYAVSAPAPAPAVNHVKIDEPSLSSSNDGNDVVVKSERNIRGAGIAGGLVGLLIGGPILAIAGGFLAAHLARKNERNAGNFCRDVGSKTASLCDRVKEWIDGNDQQDPTRQ